MTESRKEEGKGARDENGVQKVEEMKTQAEQDEGECVAQSCEAVIPRARSDRQTLRFDPIV